MALAEIEGSGTSRLEEAISIFREALLELTRERVPLKWALTQHNLGNALVKLGERNADEVKIDEAIAIFREALSVRTRDQVPLEWAQTHQSLDRALRLRGLGASHV